MRFGNRYIVICLATIIAGLSITGCSEDIQVIQPGIPIPVVYAVFDLNQTTHYVKLSKSFAGETDPYTLAADHDQIFYTEAQVFLSDGYHGNRIPFSLERDIPRSSGLFPALPNEAYSLNRKLQEGNNRLTVILPSEKDTLSADFDFIKAFKVINPKAGFKSFYFYEDPILFTWVSDPAAGLYEITLNLKFEEWMKNGEFRVKTASFSRQLNIADLEYEMGRYSYRFYSDSYFAHLGTSIPLDQAVDYRKPVDLELLITAADTTLAKYLNWFNLEIDDKVNPNGNVKGAIGVVATKYSISFPDLILSPRSQDSLVRGRYTKKLDFISNPDW
ncbi:MAG: hypothetical protein WC699_01900 [Bacteroidales bacterium]|jgi:hypothetical protein